MFSSVFPSTIDNTYHGYKLALWIFGLVVLMKGAIGFNSIVNGYEVARSADGIPLETYPAAAAETVVSLFALLGLSHVILALLAALVLIRYRSMIPLMFGLLLLEHLIKRLLLYVMPIARSETSPASAINLVLLTLLIVGLGLSLRNRREGRARAPDATGSA